MTTGALKMYFRELPEPLFTYALFHDFIGAISRFTHTSQSRLVKSASHIRRTPINWLADYLGPFFGILISLASVYIFVILFKKMLSLMALLFIYFNPKSHILQFRLL